MKKICGLVRALIVHLMIFSLVQTSMPHQVQAQTTSPVLDIAKSAMNMYGQMLGQKQQVVMQQIAMQKNQQMMQQLSPSCRKPDGTSCFTVQGKFFPECPLPASMSNMPQNVCSAATPDPMAISSMITYESIAKSWTNYYDQMSNEASNSTVPFGLKCLQDKQKAVESQITEMINNLTRLQDRLNQDKQIFRDNNKKLLDDLAVANDELMGGATKKDVNLKTMDFSKYFSQSCQSAIGKETMAEASTIGFNGLLKTMSIKNKSASDFNQNKNVIENDIRRDVERMQANINNAGIADWITNVKGPIGGDVSNLNTVKQAAGKHLAEFETSHARIQAELKKQFDYDVPRLDKNFSSDFDEFLGSSKDFFKKQYINGCVTGADKGIAIPVDEILKGMTTRLQGSVGQAYLENYRNDYKSIMESSSSVDEKQAKLEQLNKSKPNIAFTYRNGQGQVTESPYNTFMKTVAKCEEQFVSAPASGSSATSQQKKIERGQSLLRELKGLHENFTSNLGQAVLDKVMNCNGEEKKAGAACNEDTLSHKSDNFCLAQASLCANEIQGCYAEADKQVVARKTKMETLAKTYNANVAIMVARSNQLFEQQKNAVNELTKVIQARFPGTNFDIPADMFISMPEMKKDAFGVDLVNDGNLNFMEELPKKMGLLKKVFEEQREKTNGVIGEYISKQKEAMDREKGRWDKLASECKGNIDRSSSELAKMNNENLKKQEEMDAKVGNWCRKYSDLKDHPNGACDKAKKLSDDSEKISAFITSKARGVTNEFNSVCNQYNNNKDEDKVDTCFQLVEGDKDDQKKARDLGCKAILAKANASGENGTKREVLKLSKICSNKDTSDSDAFKELAKLSKNEKDKEEVAKLSSVSDLKGAIDKLDNSSFYEGLVDITKGKEICPTLSAINEDEYDKDDSELLIKKARNDEKDAVDEVNRIKNVANVTPAQTTAANEALKAAKAETLKVETAENTKKKASGKKKELKELFATFYPAPPTSKEIEMKKLSDIGERVDESCNAQASNNMMPKGFGQFNVNDYDKAKLGIAK